MAGQTCYARHRPFPQKYGRNTPDMPAGQVPLCPYLPFLWQPVITGLAVSSNYTAMPHALAESHGVVRLKSIPALWQQSCYEAVTPFRRRPGHGHTFRPAVSASVLKSGPAARRRSTAHPVSSYTVFIDPSITAFISTFLPVSVARRIFLAKEVPPCLQMASADTVFLQEIFLPDSVLERISFDLLAVLPPPL